MRPEVGKTVAALRPHDATVGASRPPAVDLSICIPYYGEIDYLRNCLASLPRSVSGYSVEIVVVDDAAPDPCAARIRAEFPHVRVIENEKNLGFAGAMNRAARASTGRYLLLLNSDTKLLDGLAVAVDYLEEAPDVGALGPRLLNPDGTFQAQCRRGRLTPISAFGYVTGLDRRFPTGKLGEYLEPWRSESEQQEVPALSGACMLVRSEVFAAHGGFDEAFVMYGEDLDLCYRIREAGRRVVYFPRLRVVHAGGRGGSRRHYYRSRRLFWRGVWMVMTRDRSGRGRIVSRSLLRVAVSMGFLGACLLRPLRLLPLGSRPRASELPPDQWPVVLAGEGKRPTPRRSGYAALGGADRSGRASRSPAMQPRR